MDRSKCEVCGVGLPRKTDKHCKEHLFFIGKCAVCGKEFRCYWFFAGTRKYCSKKCTGKANEKPSATYKCEMCGKDFSRSTKFKKGKFCSMACVSKHANLVKNGVPDGTRITFECEFCGKVVSRTPFLYNFSTHHYCSRSCSSSSGLSTRNFADVKIRNGHRTDIERIVEQFLISKNIRYEFELRVGKYSIDFAISLPQTAVECDGEYWHSKPGQPEKDKAKDKYLAYKGWTVVRLPGKCILDGSFADTLSKIFALSDSLNPLLPV
jgi:very-short-patch-repair endonuclease